MFRVDIKKFSPEIYHEDFLTIWKKKLNKHFKISLTCVSINLNPIVFLLVYWLIYCLNVTTLLYNDMNVYTLTKIFNILFLYKKSH